MKYTHVLLACLAFSGLAHAESRPNLHPPDLTAKELAALLDMRVIKGRLPNLESFWIGSYQLLFRDSKGVVRPLTEKPVAYEYDLHKKDDIGEMIISLKEGSEAFELKLIAKNYAGSRSLKVPIEKKEEYFMICSHEFRGESGETVNDLMNVVSIGDHDVFTFHLKNQKAGDKPAAIVIRTFAK